MKMAAKNDFRSVIQTFCCVAAYVLIGAGFFYAIEYTDDFDAEMSRKKQLLNKTKFEVKKRFGINETVFETLVQKVIDANSRTPLQWTYTRGIDLCWQTVTTVGYGNKTPVTLGGQLFLIPFALFGIPLMLIFLNAVGQNICYFVGFINTMIENKLFKRNNKKPCKVKLLFTVSVFTVGLLVFMAGISVKTEEWSFGQGLYVWFVTFTTVGFGDYIPGIGSSSSNEPIAICYRLVSVVIGLSLISTIFNAMLDCVEAKRGSTESKSWYHFIVSAFSLRKEKPSGNVVDMEMKENPVL